MSDLRHWDRNVAPALRAIEHNASWIANYCENIKIRAANLEYAILALPERPDWESNAQAQLGASQAQLGASIETLQLTLALCRSALDAYRNKPIMDDQQAAE